MKEEKIVVEKDVMHNGIRCVVLFVRTHRCGYVCVPKNNPAYKMDYEDIPLEVHGGLTFASDTLSEIKPTPGDYWIGFDCAHAGDAMTGDIGMISLHLREGHLWTAEETLQETKHLAEQLKSLTWKQIINAKMEFMPEWFKQRVEVK